MYPFFVQYIYYFMNSITDKQSNQTIMIIANPNTHTNAATIPMIKSWKKPSLC